MDFNTRIGAFFLKNTRLTALCFLIVLLLGVVCTGLLKTTGFPSPEVKFASVQTLYLGASSETVANEVTAPLEAALRDVEGVQSFSSTSSNSFSFIGVTIEDSASTDLVISRLNSTLSSVELPDGAEAPTVNTLSIAGPDILFSIVFNNKEKLYEVYSALEAQLLELPETAEVEPLIPLEKRVLMTLDEEKMAAAGLSAPMVQAALSSFGESLPVSSDLSIDGENQSLLTRLDEESLTDLENLTVGGKRLREIATFEVDYDFKNADHSLIGLNVDGDPLVLTALHFQIKVVKNTDIGTYTETIEKLFEETGLVTVVENNEFTDGFGRPLLLETYSVNNDNERQVKEVVSGLIGGELEHVEAPWSYAGWFLGGVQLVFLVMLFFVSFRAAVVAALSIPLSLVFSTIYIFFIGESLNTLVLFSLVLAIGLVVDPALVLLESVQRKLDTGLKGKEAALAALKDVGMGLFLACLTSAIVFIPFGVVSGILGQIIFYIPLTIIPAVVGSYIVPLVFLTWLGGYFLKARRNHSEDEEENLWMIAKAVIGINSWILRHSIVLQFIIVAVALVVPLMVAVSSVQSGAVKMTQFSSSENADYLQFSFVHFPETTMEDRERLERKVFRIVADNKAVQTVFPMEGGVYMATLESAYERGDYLSVDVADDINAVFEDELGGKFFDLKIAVISNGPPTADYQVTLALKSSDLEALKAQALVVGEDAKNLCYTEEKTFVLEDSCDGEKVVAKVDDGYSDKESTVIEVVLDRDKLNEMQLVVPGAPLTLMVNSILRDLFSVNGGPALTRVQMDGETVEVFLNKDNEAPKTLLQVKNAVLFSMGETVIRLKDVAEIVEKENQANLQRSNGETISVVKLRLMEEFADDGTAAQVSQVLLDYYEENPLEDDVQIEQYSEGDTAGFLKSFSELFTALLLAILITYVVLVVFFESFTQPLVILYTIPLTFLGVFPALAILGGGQFGFLEIIGLIILVGVVENVAIFLIDAARQKIGEGWDEIRAISYASGLRFRAVMLTKLTALASLAPLAVLSEQYRSLALVIIFGLLTSGVTSLFTTPILFIFFRRLSRFVRREK